MSIGDRVDHSDVDLDAAHAPQRPAAKEAWVKPEITSFKPVTAARGISYNRGDGLTNLTP